jgi:hypothetical protein
MDTNDEIRLRRLEELCRVHGVKVVAAKADPELNWQTLDQIIKRVEHRAKADGTKSPRNVGTSVARAIERGLDLGEGWFDWPFDNVDFKKWKALNQMQRIYLQGRISEAIEQAALITAPAEIDNILDQAQPTEAPQQSPGSAS